MCLFQKENYIIELNEVLLHFYRRDNELYMDKYIDYHKKEEVLILDGCNKLVSVILSKTNNISIIYFNNVKELYMLNYKNYTIELQILLSKNIGNIESVEIKSINNSLNIFYINEINNIGSLSFRVLSNKLVLSPSILLDNIDLRIKKPFIVSATNGKLSVCYAKDSGNKAIGYREFDFERNTWSSFNILNNYELPIDDINFLMKDDLIAYTYTYVSCNKAYIAFGFGIVNNITRGIIDGGTNEIFGSNIFQITNNQISIDYVTANSIKTKIVDTVEGIKTVDEIYLKNLDNVNKFCFESNINQFINKIMIVYYNNDIVYSDKFDVKSKFFNNIFNNDNMLDVETKTLDLDIKNNTDAINTESNNDSNGQKCDELKSFDVLFKHISNNAMIIQGEKKMLLESIDYLNDQINKKNYIISSLQKAMIEKQTKLNKYEEINNQIKSKVRQLEMQGDESSSVITSLKNKIEEYNRELSVLKDENKRLMDLTKKNETKKKLRMYINKFKKWLKS